MRYAYQSAHTATMFVLLTDCIEPKTRGLTVHRLPPPRAPPFLREVVRAPLAASNSSPERDVTTTGAATGRAPQENARAGAPPRRGSVYTRQDTVARQQSVQDSHTSADARPVGF